MRVQHGLDDGHHDRRRQAVSGSIANENAPGGRVVGRGVVPLVQREQVVGIAAGAPGRLVAGGDLQAGDSRQRRRKQRALKLANLPGFAIDLAVGASQVGGKDLVFQ